MKDVIRIVVAAAFLLLIVGTIKACSVNAERLSSDYAKDFAASVSCAKGHQGKCWCFVASRKTEKTDSTGIGMTLVPDELCK